MLKFALLCLMAVFLGFSLTAQSPDSGIVTITGDLTTIYTLGNAADDQRIDDPQAIGAFFNSQTDGTRKNGYYTAANLYAALRPVDWIEGYFKIFAVHRPGSFYMPLQMENMSKKDFAVELDSVYGRASVMRALDIAVPFDLYLKAGKFRSAPNQYGIISRYRTEQVLYMLNTKNDFTYELGAVIEAPVNLGFFAATNYLFNQSVQRLYDEDGAIRHGSDVLNEFAPQFLLGLRIEDFAPADSMTMSAEAVYGQNVSNIYSGNAIGASARLEFTVNDSISIPIGLQFAFYEKNIDLLGQAALTPKTTSPELGGGSTIDFRDTLAVALGAGIRYNRNTLNVQGNIAGSFNSIGHYYRDDLSIVQLSFDTQLTYAGRYFIGGGLLLGSLTGAEWQTREGVLEEDYYHQFNPSENIGFEIYGGLNLGNNSRFVLGFNKNKGISINNMLEARHDGQMKYKQEDSSWSTDQLLETGGLYVKFVFSF